jgi:hypothetical protein
MSKNKDHQLTPFAACLMHARNNFNLSNKISQKSITPINFTKLKNNIKKFQSIPYHTNIIASRNLQRAKNGRQNSSSKYTQLRNYISEHQTDDRLPQLLYNDY